MAVLEGAREGRHVIVTHFDEEGNDEGSEAVYVEKLRDMADRVYTQGVERVEVVFSSGRKIWYERVTG